MTVVWVIAPHGDDEALGCGGTIAKHAADGDFVGILYLCDCGEIRQQESFEAAKHLGIVTSRRFYFNEPDSNLLVTDELLVRLENVIRSYGPPDSPYSVIYAPNPDEDHHDHIVASRIGLTMAEKVGAIIRYYEVWTPNVEISETVDITPFVGQKIAAVRSYASQFRGDFENKMDEGVLGLNRYRGAVHHNPAVLYAEAFGG